jgi:hypothetical protein
MGLDLALLPHGKGISASWLVGPMGIVKTQGFKTERNIYTL